MRLPVPRSIFSWSLFQYRSRFVFFLLLVRRLTSQSALAKAPEMAETIMKNMLSAIESNSLTDFVASGDPTFRSGMTQQILDSVRQSLASRLKQGYIAKFLTSLNQQGFTVYLWKLEFNDNNDDVLATIALKDGKVSGFWLR